MMADYLEWVGRTRTSRDEVTAAPIRDLAATLDRDDPDPETGNALPQLWHWLFFHAVHKSRQMRPDGQPFGDDFMPPIPLPRRMWAGSRFEWNSENPLRVGDRIACVSRVDSITPKKGRSGELVFVRIVHKYSNTKGLSFVNEHDSVFRAAAEGMAEAAEPVRAPDCATWKRTLVPDPVLLFRYSALTFNSHRIHYDQPYATQLEGYPALVVHGPLIATLLMDLLRREAPDAVVRKLDFKAIRPTYEGRAMHLNCSRHGDTVSLSTKDDQGFLTMEASALLL